MTCTRCENTGFLNVGQLPDEVIEDWEQTGDYEVVLQWIKDNEDHDVSVCAIAVVTERGGTESPVNITTGPNKSLFRSASDE